MEFDGLDKFIILTVWYGFWLALLVATGAIFVVIAVAIGYYIYLWVDDWWFWRKYNKYQNERNKEWKAGEK